MGSKGIDKNFWHNIEDKINFSCSFINFFFEQNNTYLSQKAAQKALLFGCSGWSGSSSCSGFYSFYRIFHSTSWCFWGGTCTCTCKDKSIYSAVLKIKYLQCRGRYQNMYLQCSGKYVKNMQNPINPLKSHVQSINGNA